MSQADYEEASTKALSLFEYGQVTLFCYISHLSCSDELIGVDVFVKILTDNCCNLPSCFAFSPCKFCHRQF